MRLDRCVQRRHATRWPMRLACALVGGGLIATSLAVAPSQSAKDRMYERMLNLAFQIEGLKADGSSAAAIEVEKLTARYEKLRAALGGDEPMEPVLGGHNAGGNPQQAGAPITPPPPGCAGVTATFTAAPAAVIPNTAPPIVVSSVITVAGLPTFLWDLNLSTSIVHTFSADLDMTLMSPGGTVVTLSTDNGGANDNSFLGSFWGDDSDPDGQVPYASNDGLVTDGAYANLVAETPIVPEEAFAAFIGEDPNGDWLLTISDDAGDDGGSFDSWTLEITALTDTPVPSAASIPNLTPTPILDVATVSSTTSVSGLDPFICDVNVTTFITHTFGGDLDITLMSPGGTVVTLTTDNGGFNDNVLNGTLWDDDADPDGQVPYGTNDGLANDSLYANLVTETPLVPEDALAAFVGEDPNGDWVITISDDAGGDVGSLDSWTLEIVTCACQVLPTCTVFTNKDEFEAFNKADGKQLKGIENFEPPVGNVPPGFIVGLPGDPLMGNVPNVDPNGFGVPNGLFNKNMLIQSNALGPHAPAPALGGGLVAIGAGALGVQCPWDCQAVPNGTVGINDLLDLLAQWGGPGACDFDGGNVGITDLLKLLANWGPCGVVGPPIPNSIVVGSNSFVDSTDLIFNDADNHTGVGFDVIDGLGAGGLILISDFDKQGFEMVNINFPGDDRKQFFGVWCPSTIGRINIDALQPGGGIGGQLIDNIQLWREPAECTPFVCGGPLTFCADGVCICVETTEGFVCVDPGAPCTGIDCSAVPCPPGTICVLNTCCGTASCVDAAFLCPGPPAPQQLPGTLTITGVGRAIVPGGVSQSVGTLPK